MEEHIVRIEAALFTYFVKILKRLKNKKHFHRMLFSLVYNLSFNHNISLRNLRMAFPHKNENEIKELNRKFAYNSLNNFIDFLNAGDINKNNLKDFFTIKNYHYLENALKRGNGTIITSAHFGNFLLHATCAPLYAEKKIYDIADIECSPKLRREMLKILSSKGLNLIKREDWKNCYDVLKNNDIFILVSDQALGNKSVVKINLFNKSIDYPIGPSLISYKSKAPIIPVFTVSKKNKYEIIFEKPLKIDYSKTLDKNIKNVTQKWANLVESYVKKYPEQYFWRLRL